MRSCSVEGNRLAATSRARVISILPYIQKGGTIFDDHATEVMGKAFDSARQALHDNSQPQIVYEVIAKRIVDAARKGERDPKQLRRAGLAGLGKADAE